MKTFNERTLVLIKPDGVQRRLVGEIVQRFERTGLKIIALRFLLASQELVEKHYPSDEEWFRKVGEKSLRDKSPEEQIAFGKTIKESSVRFLTASPLVAMVLQGNQACAVVRKITGSTEPLTSDVGTIRGDLTIDSYSVGDADSRAVRNLIHASESPEEAEREISVWFKKEGLVKYRLLDEVLLTDINLDGLK